METVETGADSATASVIWLHGLGADGHDFEPIVPELQLPARMNVRFVFPHAPARPVTINGGMSMRAWYDIMGIGERFSEDREGLDNSRELVEQLIQKEMDRGIDSKRIILAGFSQGGAMTLHTGLSYSRPLAGLLVLSAYLPLRKELKQRAHEANKQTPILMAHGTSDMVVPFEFGESSKDLLLGHQYDVDWRTYPMAHSASEQELKDIGNWFMETLYQ